MGNTCKICCARLCSSMQAENRKSHEGCCNGYHSEDARVTHRSAQKTTGSRNLTSKVTEPWKAELWALYDCILSLLTKDILKSASFPWDSSFNERVDRQHDTRNLTEIEKPINYCLCSNSLWCEGHSYPRHAHPRLAGQPSRPEDSPPFALNLSVLEH